MKRRDKNIWHAEKLLTRDRDHRLIDAGTTFLEIGQLAAQNVYADDVPAAGVVTGVGQGQWCDLHDRQYTMGEKSPCSKKLKENHLI